MRKNQWYRAPDEETLGGRKCIKNKVSKELSLVGKGGEIWEYSDALYAALITKHTIANRILNPEFRFKKGDEVVVKFPKKDLGKWVKLLRVRNNRNTMIELAENF